MHFDSVWRVDDADIAGLLGPGEPLFHVVFGSDEYDLALARARGLDNAANLRAWRVIGTQTVDYDSRVRAPRGLDRLIARVLNDQFLFVVSALRAYAVWQVLLAAARAGNEGTARERVVRTPHVALGLAGASLWYWHSIAPSIGSRFQVWKLIGQPGKALVGQLFSGIAHLGRAFARPRVQFLSTHWAQAEAIFFAQILCGKRQHDLFPHARPKIHFVRLVCRVPWCNWRSVGILAVGFAVPFVFVLKTQVPSHVDVERKRRVRQTTVAGLPERAGHLPIKDDIFERTA